MLDLKLLEPDAAINHSGWMDPVIAMSIAISLKRIADTLDDLDTAEINGITEAWRDNGDEGEREIEL